MCKGCKTRWMKLEKTIIISYRSNLHVHIKAPTRELNVISCCGFLRAWTAINMQYALSYYWVAIVWSTHGRFLNDRVKCKIESILCCVQTLVCRVFFTCCICNDWHYRCRCCNSKCWTLLRWCFEIHYLKLVISLQNPFLISSCVV